MKSKVVLIGLVSLLFTVAASAQGIENDDMYFNSKDRAKLNAAKTSEVTASIKKSKKETVADEAVNPTDSYSARNVNPEYQARTNSQTAQADNQDYFVNNYKYNNASSYNNWNNNFNNWYSNPWYGGNYYDPYINSFNSPYYGSRYDMWGNPWCNPYYRSGWSSSFSYHWGSSYNYGWGMNFGYGNYGYNPYNAWGAWGSPYYGASSYYGYGGYGYPTKVVIVESGYHGPVYGKRSSRSSQLSGDNGRVARSYNNQGVETGTNGRPTIGGRTSSSVNTQSDYYNRGWRTQTQQNTSPSYSNPNSGNSNTRSSWESNTRSSWNESNSGNTSRSYDTGRSSSSGSSSSGGNSGGSSSGSSSTGSRSSGRGN